MRSRGFCGTRLCSVVLRRALGSICNGHPASEVVKNQLHTIVKKPNFDCAASYEPAGREIDKIHSVILGYCPERASLVTTFLSRLD